MEGRGGKGGGIGELSSAGQEFLRPGNWPGPNLGESWGRNRPESETINRYPGEVGLSPESFLPQYFLTGTGWKPNHLLSMSEASVPSGEGTICSTCEADEQREGSGLSSGQGADLALQTLQDLLRDFWVWGEQPSLLSPFIRG